MMVQGMIALCGCIAWWLLKPEPYGKRSINIVPDGIDYVSLIGKHNVSIAEIAAYCSVCLKTVYNHRNDPDNLSELQRLGYKKMLSDIESGSSEIMNKLNFIDCRIVSDAGQYRKVIYIGPNLEKQ